MPEKWMLRQMQALPLLAKVHMSQARIREWYEHWNGDNFIDDEQYENKVKDAIANVDDCYVCYVDIHD